MIKATSEIICEIILLINKMEKEIYNQAVDDILTWTEVFLAADKDTQKAVESLLMSDKKD